MNLTWETLTLLIAAIGGFTTTAVLIYRAKAEKGKLTEETGKLSAEAAAVISNSALLLLEPMSDRIASLEARIKTAVERVETLDKLLLVSTTNLKEITLQLSAARVRIDQLLREREGRP